VRVPAGSARVAFQSCGFSSALRPGVRLLKADVEALENGVVQPPITLRTQTAWLELTFGYQPSKIFSIRGDVHADDNGLSYTAISLHTEMARARKGSWGDLWPVAEEGQASKRVPAQRGIRQKVVKSNLPCLVLICRKFVACEADLRFDSFYVTNTLRF
jgi:hypothetical protein